MANPNPGRGTQFSAFKIAKSIINANMKFFGGDNVPALRKMVDFGLNVADPTVDAFAALKMPETTRRKITRMMNENTTLSNQIAQQETKINQIKASYIVGFSAIVVGHTRLVSLRYTTSTVIYSVSTVVSIDTGIGNIGYKFYAIKPNALPSQDINRYNSAVNQLKQLERDYLVEKQKLNTYKRQFKYNIDELTRITSRL